MDDPKALLDILNRSEMLEPIVKPPEADNVSQMDYMKAVTGKVDVNNYFKEWLRWVKQMYDEGRISNVFSDMRIKDTNKNILRGLYGR